MSNTPLTDAVHKPTSPMGATGSYWRMLGHAQLMEHERAVLLECVRETAKWADKLGYADQADRLRTVINKVTTT